MTLITLSKRIHVLMFYFLIVAVIAIGSALLSDQGSVADPGMSAKGGLNSPRYR